MNQICVHIPPLQTDHTIELEVTVDGKKRMMNYRVESFDWPVGIDPEDRIARLQAFIHAYDRHWELVQIGTPAGNLLPVMFRQRVS
jgi:hypothetical protein